MAVYIAIANIVSQNGASNTIGIEPVVFAYAVRCTIVVGTFAIGRKEMLREKRTQFFCQCRNDLFAIFKYTPFFERKKADLPESGSPP